MEQALGEIVWLMSQSPAHRQMFISDLEWLIMPPLLLGQFRLFHAPTPTPGAVSAFEGGGKNPPGAVSPPEGASKGRPGVGGEPPTRSGEAGFADHIERAAGSGGASPQAGAGSAPPQRPIGVVLWAQVDAEVEARLAAGGARMRPQDWRSGDRLWVVVVIAAAGPGAVAEAMVADMKRAVFPMRTIKLRRVVGGAASVSEV